MHGKFRIKYFWAQSVTRVRPLQRFTSALLFNNFLSTKKLKNNYIRQYILISLGKTRYDNQHLNFANTLWPWVLILILDKQFAQSVAFRDNKRNIKWKKTYTWQSSSRSRHVRTLNSPEPLQSLLSHDFICNGLKSLRVQGINTIALTVKSMLDRTD